MLLCAKDLASAKLLPTNQLGQARGSIRLGAAPLQLSSLVHNAIRSCDVYKIEGQFRFQKETWLGATRTGRIPPDSAGSFF